MASTVAHPEVQVMHEIPVDMPQAQVHLFPAGGSFTKGLRVNRALSNHGPWAMCP